MRPEIGDGATGEVAIKTPVKELVQIFKAVLCERFIARQHAPFLFVVHQVTTDISRGGYRAVPLAVRIDDLTANLLFLNQLVEGVAVTRICCGADGQSGKVFPKLSAARTMERVRLRWYSTSSFRNTHYNPASSAITVCGECQKSGVATTTASRSFSFLNMSSASR